MKSMEVKSSLHISLPSDLLKQLNSYSELLGISRNQIIENLLEQWIGDQNDIKLSEQVLNDIKEGKEQVVSWKEMKKRLTIKE